MNIFQLLINHFFSALCIVIPVFNLLPYKLSNKIRRFMFMFIFSILCVTYLAHVSNYTNIMIVPIFVLLIAKFSKENMLPNLLFSILAYILTVLTNNLMISGLLALDINIVTFNVYGQFLFLVVYNTVIITITFLLGKYINTKIYIVNRFVILYESIFKRLIIIVPITLAFFVYNVLVHAEKINSYSIDMTIINTIKTTFIFLILTVLYSFIIFKFFCINQRYEKKIEVIAQSIDKLKDIKVRELEVEENVKEKKDININH